MKILILNGALGGKDGNTAVLLKDFESILGQYGADVQVIHLVKSKFDFSLYESLISADALIIGTGTYWDSWGSPLQLFLEWLTPLEGKEIVGKPVSIVVTAHSVGAKGILNRLQGVLSTFGFLIAPMTGMVITLASQEAFNISRGSWKAEELWNTDDLCVLAHNLMEATKFKGNWKTYETGGEESCNHIWIK